VEPPHVKYGLFNHLPAHHLYLSNGHPVSIRQFPSLHSIELHEANRPGLLAEITQFLSPRNTPLKIRSILLTIDLFRDQEEAFLQAASQPAWALLDNACTNAQLYRDLEKVQISLSFFHDQRHTKHWERAILDVLEDCSSRLLPLLSTSARVELEFVVEISFLHMQRIRWHNGNVLLPIERSERFAFPLARIKLRMSDLLSASIN
jgi:hypothetical protein